MENNRRVQRVEKEIREIVSQYIVFQLSGLLEGMVSVTKVLLSRDLRNAKVLVYCKNKEDLKSNLHILNEQAPQIQKKINEQIRMKYCPKVTFIEDEKYEDAVRVEEALRQLELENRAAKKLSDS